MNYAYTLHDIVFGRGEQFSLNINQLEIKVGEIRAIIGENGAGKSTLFDLLAFQSKPCSGHFCFYGQNTASQSLDSLRRRVALVHQNPYLLSGTVVENVELGLKFRGSSLKLRRSKAMQTLKRLGIESLAERSTRALSGGETQKVVLARSLVYQPEVLLLDEPFSYIDRDSKVFIEKLIISYARDLNRTVIFSTHDRIHGMALADRVLSLLNGRMVNTPLINLYHGRVEKGKFDTGKISILLPEDIKWGSHAAIDPNEVVLSREPLKSSIRNAFSGRIILISDEFGRVRVAAQGKERFEAFITRQSLEQLQLNLGEKVWVNFKSTIVKVF